MAILLFPQIVEVYERDKGVGYNYYLLQVSSTVYDVSLGDGLEEGPQAFLRPGHMIQLDSFICTHGATAKLYSKQHGAW